MVCPSLAAVAVENPSTGVDLLEIEGRDVAKEVDVAEPPMWEDLSVAADVKNSARIESEAGMQMPRLRGWFPLPGVPCRCIDEEVLQLQLDPDLSPTS